ncbi:MAG: hypothetical protein E7774_16685 [Bradyrhizobium sp.]|nr:MAG: hypothetical protein E7774_16685 [Bradyrhizobium sp.]
MRIALIVTSVAAMGIVAANAQSANAISKIQFGPLSAIPNGYYELCSAYPDLCRMKPGRIPVTADGSVTLTSAMMDELKSVNSAVNATITPAYRDTWAPGEPAGDCKDFAMTKRQRLIDSGWPSSALPAAIVVTAAGELHLVLIARTSEGDFVLDNLTSQIVPWTKVSYAWEKIQSTTDGLNWRVLQLQRASPAEPVDGATGAVGAAAYATKSGGVASVTKASSAASRPIVD